MIDVEKDKQEMQDVAISYRDTKANLNEALFSEFENDFKSWNATITKDNSIVFSSPELLFDISSSEIKDEFKIVLNQFFARYLKILSSPKYKDEIQELRVEGHTSNTWKNITSQKDIYLKNMQLSQNRAYNVLAYCYAQKNIKEYRPWLEKYFRANGMAFSKFKSIKTARRVEFTIQLKSEEKVNEFLNNLDK
jgi:outer membrane protein OmpA-like peptidoglycan-associated protein